MGIKEGCANLGEVCKVLFNEAKQTWEDPAAYEARMQAVRELEKKQELFRFAFDAENYYLSQDRMLGYMMAEMVQIVFGGEILKGAAKGVSKGGQFVKEVQQGVRVQQEMAEGIKLAEGAAEGIKLGDKAIEGAKVSEKIYQAEQKLIGPAGDATARFVDRMPKDWVSKTARNKKGTKYINPKNSGDYIRFSAENADVRAPLGQQVSYFERWKDGKCLTKEGKWVYPKTVAKIDYHIPQSMFDELSHLLNF